MKFSNGKKELKFLWIIAFAISAVNSNITDIHKYIIPLVISFSIAIILKKESLRCYSIYLLFFTISITSFLGFTETLTGSHAESTNLVLYGLSFYTASLAYILKRKQYLTLNDVLKASNPLLLSTGPIALFIKSLKRKNLLNRVNYYLPYIIIGFFFFQVVASPLTELFFLIESTDLVSSITFAIIFEIFVYMNFAGLSLLIYGIFGIIGWRIPLNFKQPFSSRNLVDFWKGWHRSLSEVLKILFYSPIRKRLPQSCALFGVFIASALWHGVTTNLFIWGFFHASMFWISVKALQRKILLLPMIISPIAIILGRLIFADSNTNRLLEKLTFEYQSFNVFNLILKAPTTSILALLLGFIIILIEYIFKDHRLLRKRNYKFLRTPIMLAVIVFLSCLLLSDVGIDYAVYGQR